MKRILLTIILFVLFASNVWAGDTFTDLPNNTPAPGAWLGIDEHDGNTTRISPADLNSSLVVAASGSTDKVKSTADYICNGTADQVEINAAIIAAVAAGVPVYLRGSAFSINAPISLRSCTELYGRILKTIIRLADNSDCNMIEFPDIGEHVPSWIRLEGLNFSGNKGNQASGNGLEFIVDPMDTFIHECFFQDMKEIGIKQPYGWGNSYSNLIIEYCDGVGLSIGASTTISSSKIISNAGGGIIMTGDLNKITKSFYLLLANRERNT